MAMTWKTTIEKKENIIIIIRRRRRGKVGMASVWLLFYKLAPKKGRDHFRGADGTLSRKLMNKLYQGFLFYLKLIDKRKL